MQEFKEAPALAGAGVLLRLYWIGFGNIVLLFLLIFALEREPAFPSLMDLVYFLVLVSVIGVRYVDIRFYNGTTAEGRLATPGHWRRYALWMSGAGLCAWGLARLAAHLT